jgi:hypothetical protein
MSQPKRGQTRSYTASADLQQRRTGRSPRVRSALTIASADNVGLSESTGTARADDEQHG